MSTMAEVRRSELHCVGALMEGNLSEKGANQVIYFQEGEEDVIV